MNSSFDIIPHLSIHPDKICTYSEIKWNKPHSKNSYKINSSGEIESRADRIKDSSRSAEGKVSKIARRKISKATDYLLLQARPQTQLNRISGKHVKFRIAFITLTLPSLQIHSDNEIKSKCLNSFLLELKKFYQVRNYIWRAEKQANGNLHFHVITDKFVPWSEIRDRWNRIVNKLGYVDRYREEMIKFHSEGFKVRNELLKTWEYKAQVKAYQTGKANDFSNPNSTDIHSVGKIGNIKAYISKYMTKNDTTEKECKNGTSEHQKQIGRIWGCNFELSNITGAQLIIDSEISAELEKAVKNSHCQKYEDSWFTVYYIDFESLPKFGAGKLFEYFCSYLIEKFNFNYQLKIA